MGYWNNTGFLGRTSPRINCLQTSSYCSLILFLLFKVDRNLHKLYYIVLLVRCSMFVVLLTCIYILLHRSEVLLLESGFTVRSNLTKNESVLINECIVLILYSSILAAQPSSRVGCLCMT
jgi:hypothetical protein